jgi:hypothetical protein
MELLFEKRLRAHARDTRHIARTRAEGDSVQQMPNSPFFRQRFMPIRHMTDLTNESYALPSTSKTFRTVLWLQKTRSS